MKKRIVYYCLLLLLSSCTLDSDLDIIGLIDYPISVEKEVELLFTEQKEAFAEYGLKLKGVKNIASIERISLNDIFNDDFSCYPIYSADLKKMKLVSRTQFTDDSVAIHFKYDYLLSYVDSILQNRQNIEFRELIWDNNGIIFKTIGLFNKYSGELEYEHILFNTYSSKRKSWNNEKHLSRGESSNGKSGFEYVSFAIGNHILEYAITWSIGGDYSTIDYINRDGDSARVRVFFPRYTRSL